MPSLNALSTVNEVTESCFASVGSTVLKLKDWSIVCIRVCFEMLNVLDQCQSPRCTVYLSLLFLCVGLSTNLGEVEHRTVRSDFTSVLMKGL